MNSKIFKYNDGFGDVYGDPAEIDYRMAKASDFEDMTVIDKWLDIPRNDDGTVDEAKVTDADKRNFMEACHRILPMIRAGFEVKEFDKTTGEGMTMDGLLLLYASYLEWKLDVKKNTEPPPAAVTPMDLVEISSGTLMEPLTPPRASRPTSAFMDSISTSGGARASRVPSSTGRSSISTP